MAIPSAAKAKGESDLDKGLKRSGQEYEGKNDSESAYLPNKQGNTYTERQFKSMNIKQLH